MNKYADFKFNGGNGAVLCNACRTIVKYGHDYEDRLHFCDGCSDAIKQNSKYWKDQNN